MAFHLDKKIERTSEESKKNFEARHNASGFFDLLFKVAIRENIDIGQYENNRNTNNTDKA